MGYSVFDLTGYPVSRFTSSRFFGRPDIRQISIRCIPKLYCKDQQFYISYSDLKPVPLPRKVGHSTGTTHQKSSQMTSPLSGSWYEWQQSNKCWLLHALSSNATYVHMSNDVAKTKNIEKVYTVHKLLLVLYRKNKNKKFEWWLLIVIYVYILHPYSTIPSLYYFLLWITLVATGP